MAQLINSSINLTLGGAEGVAKPEGTLFYGSDGKYYVSDSGINGPYAVGTSNAPSYSTTATIYTENGTWNNPLYLGENITLVLVFLLGGGGGGARGPATDAASNTYALGGAGGGASIMMYPAIALGPVYPITVGAGGTGGSAGSEQGSAGGITSFGALPGSTSALLGGSAWFGALYAAGGEGGRQALDTDTTSYPGGNGLYMGSPSSFAAGSQNSLWYAGAAGGAGGNLLAAQAGGTAGSLFGTASTLAAGALGAANSPGGDGVSPAAGILRGGSGGGGGGRGATTGGRGGNGGVGAGGGGGGSAPTAGTPGNGGNGGNGYAVVISW